MNTQNTPNFFETLKYFNNPILVNFDKIICQGTPIEVIVECARKGIPTDGAIFYSKEIIDDYSAELLRNAGITIAKPTQNKLYEIEIPHVSNYGDFIESFMIVKNILKNLNYNIIIIETKFNLYEGKHLIVNISKKDELKFKFHMQEYDLIPVKLEMEIDELKLNKYYIDGSVIKDVDYIN